MQKRVVYNFNAQTATESAAKNSTGKAVKASNAISKIKSMFMIIQISYQNIQAYCIFPVSLTDKDSLDQLNPKSLCTIWYPVFDRYRPAFPGRFITTPRSA